LLQYFFILHGMIECIATQCPSGPSALGACNYMITIIQRLSIYTSMKHSLLLLKHLALALNSLDTLSDIRIEAFALLF